VCIDLGAVPTRSILTEMEDKMPWHLSHGRLSFHTIWVILECDEELRRMYASLFMSDTGIKIHGPKFGSHVSVIRGEEEGIVPGLWERNLQGPTVSFEYEDVIRYENSYVWLDVRSRQLEDLREGLGLTKAPPFGYHLTLGKEANL